MGNTKMGMNFYSESLFFTQTKPTGEVSGQPALLHVVSQGFSLLLQHHFLTLSSKFTKRPNHLCLQATHPLAIWPNVGENAPDSVLASSDLPLHPFSLQTFFFFFLAAPVACGSSGAGDRTYTTATATATVLDSSRALPPRNAKVSISCFSLCRADGEPATGRAEELEPRPASHRQSV